MADAEDIYTSRILVDAEQALTKLQELRANIDEYKAKMLEMSKSSTENFALLAESIKRTAKAQRDAAIDSIKPGSSAADGMRIISEANEKYKTDLKALSQAVKELNAQQRNQGMSAQQSFQAASAGASQYAQQIRQLQIMLQQIAQQQNVTLQAAAQGMKQAGVASQSMINQALQGLTKSAGGAQSALSSMGAVASFVFGSVLGLGAVQALQKLIAVMKDAIKEFTEFELAQRRLEVAVRAFQRSGLNTTLSEWRDMMADIKEMYPIFSEKQLTEGAAAIGLKLREFEFTVEEMNNTLKVSAALAVLNGKSFNETADLIARAMGSGNFEAVQRMGLNISRMAIASKAAAMGIKESYTAMDDATRAHIAYTLLMEQGVKIMDDAAKAQDTLWAKQEKLNSAWSDAMVALGRISGPGMKLFYDALTILVIGFENALEIFSALLLAVRSGTGIMIDLFISLGTAIRTRTIPDILELLKILGSFDERYKKYIEQEFLGVKLGDTDVIPSNDSQRQGMEDLLGFWTEFQEELTQIQEENQIRRRDMEIDYTQDVQRIWRDFYNDLAQLQIDYDRKRQDILVEYFRDLADENQRYQDQLMEEDMRAQSRRAEIERKYREREYNAERDYQEKLRRLREEFLMDLEDALHERDARQVLRLIKRYNLEKARVRREEQERQRRDRAAYQGELEDAENQRKERMKMLALEHQQRIRDINIQKQRELIDARVWFNREMADLRTKNAIELQERRIKYQQEMEELQRHLEDRINALAAKLAEEYNLTASTMKKIYQVLNGYYGPGGSISGVYAYAAQMIANLNAALLMIDMSKINKSTPKKTEPLPKKKKKDEQTLAELDAMDSLNETENKFDQNKYGFNRVAGGGGLREESSGSLASRVFDQNKYGFNRVAGGGGFAEEGTGQGKLHILVELSPDLEVRIVDNALGNMADVLTQKRNRMAL